MILVEQYNQPVSFSNELPKHIHFSTTNFRCTLIFFLDNFAFFVFFPKALTQ